MSAADREESPRVKAKGTSGSKAAQKSAGAKATSVSARPKADMGPFADDMPAVAEEPARPRPEEDNGFEAKALAFLMRHLWAVVALIVPVALVVGVMQGAQAVILVLIAAALIAVIALFWSSLRTVLGETPLSGADAYALAAPRAEEEQKQAVLRALKDLEFERSVGKISDEDYAVLVTKYRAEAKRLLRVIEEEARPRRERVEWLVQKRLAAAGLATDPVAEREPVPATKPAAEDKKAGDDKKNKKKSKAKDAEKPANKPIAEVEITPLDEAAAEPKADVTLKSQPPVVKTQESPAYVPPTKTCSECGAKNDPDANFCKKCGSKAFEAAAEKAALESKGDEEADGGGEEADAGGDEAEKEARS
ncbi:MAG: zinc ribbon domain-containing protein [Polyangiaceae bacterium]